MAIGPITGSAEFFKSIRNINSAKKSSIRKVDSINAGGAGVGASDVSKLIVDQGLRSRLRTSSTISENLASLKATVSIAQSGVSGISDLANNIQEKLILLAETGNTDGEQNSIRTDLESLLKQAQSFVESSGFNNDNLIKSDAQDLAVAATNDGENILVSSQGALGAAVTALQGAITNGARINDPVSILLNEFETFEAELSNAAISLGEAERAITLREDSNRDFQEAVIQNLGNILETDIARNGVKTLARTIQTQLSNQSLSIVNSASSSIIKLFK